jgi:hypothetical protein
MWQTYNLVSKLNSLLEGRPTQLTSDHAPFILQNRVLHYWEYYISILWYVVYPVLCKVPLKDAYSWKAHLPIPWWRCTWAHVMISSLLLYDHAVVNGLVVGAASLWRHIQLRNEGPRTRAAFWTMLLRRLWIFYFTEFVDYILQWRIGKR